MSAPRIIWRRACAVRLNRPAAFEAIHAELAEAEARRWARIGEDISALLDAELELDFQEQRT